MRLFIKNRKRALARLKSTSGVGTVEIILILVVLIALVLIFKSQLISLVSDTLDKITRQAGSI